MSRNIKDALLEVETSFPAAAADTTSTAIDLGQVNGGELENIVVELDVPALTALVEDKTATFTLVHGDAANSLSATDPAITSVLTGASGNGHAAYKCQFRLPPSCKRYIGIKCAVLTGGGDNTAKKYTTRVLV